MKKQQYIQPQTEALKMNADTIMLPSSPGGEYNPAPSRGMGTIEGE